MSRKHSDLSFMKAPLPWTDDVDFRLAEKETIAAALYEIALLKGLLECPGASADKIEYARLIDRLMVLACRAHLARAATRAICRRLCGDCSNTPRARALRANAGSRNGRKRGLS